MCLRLSLEDWTFANDPKVNELHGFGPELKVSSKTGGRLPTITKDTLPWKLRDEGPNSTGALSHTQIDALSQKYELGLDAVATLSRNIDIGLSRDLHLLQHELGPARTEKGVKDLKIALKNIRSAEEKLQKASRALEHLRFKSPIRIISMPNPGPHRIKSFEENRAGISDARSFLEIVERTGLVFSSQHPDKRKISDVRRTIVCTGIFNCWHESDRNLSFTTDPLTSKRGGPLFDFANEVVALITEPSSHLKGEALKSELDLFKSSMVDL